MKNARLQLNRCIGFLLAAIMLAGLVPCSLITAEADTSYTSNVIGPLQIEEDFGEPDPSVDLETEADFEASLNNLVLKGMPYNERVLAVAMTQLGNHESETNFIVKEDEATHEKAKYGITRYGQWYGLPYEDWCAMFISFCLHYAEVPSELMPIDSGVITTMHKLQQAELYCSRGEDYQPKPGDLIFFDFDFDGQGDHVGLVADLTWEDDAEVVKTIEGNHTTTVEYFAYN